MLLRSVMGSVALAVVLIARPAAAQQPFEENKYPAMAGQWLRVGPLGVFDSTKPPARGQEAPLTAEYQARFEANLADVAKGGSGDDPVHTCIPEGMPRAMNLVLPMCMSCGDCVAACPEEAIAITAFIEFHKFFRYLDRGKPEPPRRF